MSLGLWKLSDFFINFCGRGSHFPEGMDIWLLWNFFSRDLMWKPGLWISSFTTAKCPLQAAIIKAVSPWLPAAFPSTPATRAILTFSVSPCLHISRKASWLWSLAWSAIMNLAMSSKFQERFCKGGKLSEKKCLLPSLHSKLPLLPG